MPMGTGAPTLNNIPSTPFVVDPGSFINLTTKNVYTPKVQAAPGSGLFSTVQIPQVGILAKVRMAFVGSMVVATGGATASDLWPHGILSKFVLGVNGQNDLYSVDGLDLHSLRFVRFPAFEDATDVYPGTLGASSAIAAGTYPLHITFEVAIATDESTLVGSLYAQSAATVIQVELTQATTASLFGTNPGNVAITGNFYVQSTHFEIPYNEEGKLIIPDLSRLHGLNAQEYPFTATGENRVPLIRNAGQLHRLFVSSRSSSTNRLSIAPSAASTRKIDRLRLEYGGNKVPMDWNPAGMLQAENNQHYGAPAPYDRAVIDFVRENPMRDVVLLQGLTEFAAVPTIGSGVTVTAGSTRLVQETLF